MESNCFTIGADFCATRLNACFFLFVLPRANLQSLTHASWQWRYMQFCHIQILKFGPWLNNEPSAKTKFLSSVYGVHCLSAWTPTRTITAVWSVKDHQCPYTFIQSCIYQLYLIEVPPAWMLIQLFLVYWTFWGTPHSNKCLCLFTVDSPTCDFIVRCLYISTSPPQENCLIFRLKLAWPTATKQRRI